MQVPFPRRSGGDASAGTLRRGPSVAALLAVSAALGLTVLAAAIPPSLAAPRAQATPEAATPAVPDQLLGIYTVAIGEADVPRDLPGGPSLRGLWTMTFNADGTYVVARQDVGGVASGSYEVTGSTLTLNDWAGILGCSTPTEVDTAATYAWQRQDDSLTLTPITDNCPSRKILLGTRAFGSYQACATIPLSIPLLPAPGPEGAAPGYGPSGAAPAATPLAPAATPATAVPSVAQQEGLPQGATPQDAIDVLLQQATGCWATQDPARFLPLHSQKVFAELSQLGPLPEVANQLKSFMATPVSFERIGNDFHPIDDTHAWAYVEISVGGSPLPQRLDFVNENGTWLLDTFFLLPEGPGTTPAVPTPGVP